MREACTRLQVPITSQEAENTYRSKTFQRVLRSERNRFFIEVAEDPARTKTTAIGQLLFSLERLAEAGEHAEVVEGLLKLARIEGWTSGEGQSVTVLGLTQKELDDIRKSVGSREAVKPLPS